MSLDAKLRNQLQRVLSTLDDQGALGPRLAGDARRLWDRLGHFIAMDLVGPDVDAEGLELACYAMQLPTRQGRGLIAGKLGRTNLRERCEQAAELLVGLMANDIDEKLLDRTTRLLHEVPQRSPMLDEARLLADAVNLDDFGITGLVGQTVQLALQGEGIAELALAWTKREEYGYWEARLKDGFHFEPIRQVARRRLEKARQLAAQLQSELDEDKP
ncbi:MAG TPA: hypothetical protein VMD30_11205 [Tepidisphaeraceae bacterium]|nr:hypothetical protein [Tepidisphaeraceae bacterium]